MRVLQVHTSYREPGGEDTVVRAEAALLRRAGHEVTTHWIANPVRPLESLGPLLRSAWNPQAARIVRSLIHKTKPDVAHVHNTWFAQSPAVVAALRQGGVPVVATLHNYRLMCANSSLFRDGRPCVECVGSSPLPGVIHRCYRGSFALSAVSAGALAFNQSRRTWDKNVRLVLVPSDFMLQLFRRSGSVRQRIRVKPHFVEDPGQRVMPPSTAQTVLFVGRLAAEKGVEVLLKAWMRLSSTSLTLTVIGEGPLRPKLEAEAGPGVTFRGRLPSDEVRRMMLEARALVFPSVWYEPFGMVLIEAMACGLPIVGSDVGAVPDIVQPKVCGSLVEPGNADLLADAITLLNDDEFVDQAGSRARERYEAEFTPAANLAMLESAYRAVII